MVLTLIASALAFAALAADSPKQSEDQKPQHPPPVIVRADAIAPAGQTFSRPVSTFSPAIAPEIPVKGGTFSRPESTFSASPGSFRHPGPTFATPAGSFSRSPSFQMPPGSFSRPASTFSNPTQAASPLPRGAFGTPIRPPSTFERAPAISLAEPARATPLVVIDLPPGATIRKVVPSAPAK